MNLLTCMHRSDLLGPNISAETKKALDQQDQDLQTINGVGPSTASRTNVVLQGATKAECDD